MRIQRYGIYLIKNKEINDTKESLRLTVKRGSF